MKKKDVRQVIENLPKDMLNDINKVQHFFYGKNESLDYVRDEIAKDNKDIMFSNENESLIVMLDTKINEETLFKVAENFQSIASSYKVEYDGFQVILDDYEVEQPKFLPFENFFEPESYVKIQLSNSKYAYLLFLGGNMLSGHFFECLHLTDNGNASVEVLDKTSRIFRQPIQGVFNPQICSYVGATKEKRLPIDFSFRLMEDNCTPEQIDELYKRYNISESENNSWLRVLDKISQFGYNDLMCKSTMKYEVSIGGNGKAKWSNILPLSTNENIPMPFGAFLDNDKINAIFIDNLNELELIDKVYNGFVKDEYGSIVKH